MICSNLEKILVRKWKNMRFFSYYKCFFFISIKSTNFCKNRFYDSEYNLWIFSLASGEKHKHENEQECLGIACRKHVKRDWFKNNLHLLKTANALKNGFNLIIYVIDCSIQNLLPEVIRGREEKRRWKEIID